MHVLSYEISTCLILPLYLQVKKLMSKEENKEQGIREGAAMMYLDYV